MLHERRKLLQPHRASAVPFQRERSGVVESRRPSAFPPPPSRPRERTASTPCVRASVLTAYRLTAARMFGPAGLEDIAAALPPDCLMHTLRSPAREDWVPEYYLVDWVHAIWEGPAKQDARTFDRFIEQEIRQGFGTFRALFLSVAVGPRSLLGRSEGFWRDFHTHGRFVVTPAQGDDAREVTVELSDHPYCDAPLTRKMFAESLRNILALTRAKGTRASHTYGGGTLRVKLGWD